jgi:glyoxylate reductase
MTRVFITRRLPAIARESLEQAGFDVHQSGDNAPCPPDELVRAVGEYDVVLSTISERLDEDLLRRKGRLSVISNYAVGLDNINVHLAASLGVAVYNTPDVVTESTADLTFGLLLGLIRQMPAAQAFVKDGHWKAWDPELFLGEELRGKVLGILGLGRVGTAVARRALGFGLRVIYYDLQNRIVELGFDNDIKPVSLEELYRRSDYLAIHVPLTPDTKGMVNRAAFSQMIRRPVIINMARGPIVVTDDLVEALEGGVVRGAALDVVTPDRIDGAHPLCRLPNVIVVPHIGTATTECRANMAALAARNIINHFA